MGNSLRSFALRAVMPGFGLALAAPIAELNAASVVLSPGPATLLRKSTEPFGLATSLLAGGGLRDKWLGVQRQLADEFDLELLAGWMTGNFSSQAQAQRDSSFFDIRLTIAPIWKARRDARWFYVEQARGDKLDRPYRQRVYRVRESEPGVFESTVFTLPAPLRFVGAWKQALPLGTLTPDSLQERRGCALYLHRRDHSFVGSTQGKDCPSELRGAAYATSEVHIDAEGMTTLDRGFDTAGHQVWGKP